MPRPISRSMWGFPNVRGPQCRPPNSRALKLFSTCYGALGPSGSVPGAMGSSQGCRALHRRVASCLHSLAHPLTRPPPHAARRPATQPPTQPLRHWLMICMRGMLGACAWSSRQLCIVRCVASTQASTDCFFSHKCP